MSKLLYPFLQAVNVSGSSITAANILDKLFDAYIDVRKKARGNASEFLMSYKHWGSCMKALQSQKGPFVVTKDPQKTLYGWTAVTIASTATGDVLTIVGIQEMEDDIIALVDWDSIIFRSNGLVKKRVSPDGRSYFETRTEDGYAYIIDVCCFGEVEYTKPTNNGIIYGISY